MSVRFADLATLGAYFAAHNLPTYERVGYDRYLHDTGFAYRIPSVHITGTNGKGSTATFIQEIYHAAGYKVGLFTSPYFDDATEMFVIGHAKISEAALLSYMNAMVADFERYALTTFEMQCLIAFRYFTDQKVDLSVIEVGMGGATDATNVFTPVLAIITRIGLEHTHYLGNTVEDIAAAKAGIFKSGVPALIGAIDGPARDVLVKRASALHAPLTETEGPQDPHFAQGHLAFSKDGITFDLDTEALYQADNAALALDAVKILKDRFPVAEAALRAGLWAMHIPGRMEKIGSEPTFILDGAHNPQAAEALADALRVAGYQDITIVFAAFSDKNVHAIFETLDTISHHIIVTTFAHPRARKREDYEDLRYLYIDDDKLAIRLAAKWAPKGSIILITGSLAFVGEIRRYLKEGHPL